MSSGREFGHVGTMGVANWFNPLKELEKDKLNNGGGSGGGGNGLGADFWFGNKERAGAVQVGTQAVTGAIGSWLGYQEYQLAKESLAMQKEQFAQNKAAANMEAALKLDARKRGLAAHGISSDIVNKYAAQYK